MTSPRAPMLVDMLPLRSGPPMPKLADSDAKLDDVSWRESVASVCGPLPSGIGIGVIGSVEFFRDEREYDL